jgi:beta-aspartyl-peptidase (threonine type)
VLAVLTLLCVPIAFLIFCSNALRGESPAAKQGKPSPGQPIRTLLGDQAKAWNAGKLEEFMAGYWNSDELTFFSGGTVEKGYAAVLARYRKRYQSEGKEMGKLTFSDLDVTPMGARHATARGRWKVVTSKQTMSGLFTLTLEKFPAGWKITHDHTSKADPPKP